MSTTKIVPSVSVTKKPRGRPVVPDDQRRDDSIKIRVTAAEKAKFEALGGADWFRPLLQRAKVKA